MASDATPLVLMGDAPPNGAALQHKHWRKLPDLSSGLARAEQFLAGSQFELANWVVVAFAAWIAAWFVAGYAAQWRGIICAGLALSLGAAAMTRAEGGVPYLRRSIIMSAMAVALGCGFV